ncbi:leucine-rich repeat-containing G-protein coupled receptor 4-like isoform X2 [Heterodontus francisci]|uniref:leucine-rich repeat-containing G-protein coupled receptor 4-like isoform X2 n=1 Tax=Heterodontus francisci TaxID=7792 RepID=UPI00355C7113
MTSSSGLLTLASCLLLWCCSEAKKTMVVLHHNGSSEVQPPEEPHALCPHLCRCYINILSCHPALPVGSHSRDEVTFETGPTEAGTKSPHAKNHTTLEPSMETLTEVPQGIRGTMSGNVLTPFTVLNLKGNRLTDLIPETFEGLSHLKYLFLSYNQIRFIADYMFQPTPEIELIDISNNKVYAIQRDLFRTKHGLRSLKVLDLSNNNILVLGPGAFSQLSSLHFLNVSDNYLSLIGTEAFDHLSSIIYLDLRATSISLDVLKSILESTINIVNLYISHTLKCCLCKYPHLNKLILTRDVEINCKNIFCTISLMQCYTKEVKKQNILKDKERIIEEMEAVKAGTVSSLSEDKHDDETQNKVNNLERSRNPEPRNLEANRIQPELGLEILNKDLQLGDKQAEMKDELLNKNLDLKNKIKDEESTRDAERDKLKQYNIAKLSPNSQRPELPDLGGEENTLGRLHKLKEALKSLYHYASHRIANKDGDQLTVKLES